MRTLIRSDPVHEIESTAGWPRNVILTGQIFFLRPIF